MKIVVTTYYKFTHLEPEKIQTKLLKKGDTLGLKGLTLVAPEGINGTISGEEEKVNAWKTFLVKTFGEIVFKDSPSGTKPFKRWLVKIKPSIVNIGIDSIKPDTTGDTHLTPDEWNEMLHTEDVTLIDTRNDYETQIGTFKGAIDPKIKSFSDFPAYVKKAKIPKDKPVMMFCTGGIRCEKAVIAMKDEGYEEVYQLKGGILQYLKEHPDEEFEGECFVFDQRVAVQQDLRPSEKYGMCPHTGDPATVPVTCEICGTSTKVRESCNDIQKRTCSKDCAYRLVRIESK